MFFAKHTPSYSTEKGNPGTSVTAGVHLMRLFHAAWFKFEHDQSSLATATRPTQRGSVQALACTRMRLPLVSSSTYVVRSIVPFHDPLLVTHLPVAGSHVPARGVRVSIAVAA